MPRAFEYVQKGEELCEEERLPEAEYAFRQAIKACEKERDADGIAYALGRMGACY
jgi:hypothetical protein